MPRCRGGDARSASAAATAATTTMTVSCAILIILALGSASSPVASVGAFTSAPAALRHPPVTVSTAVVRQRQSAFVFVAHESQGRAIMPSTTTTPPLVVRRMSDVGGGINDRPPSGGGSGGSGGGNVDDFLGRDGDGESDNLRGARERMAEDSLPISFGLERADIDALGMDGEKEEEEEGEGDGDDGDVDDQQPNGAAGDGGAALEAKSSAEEKGGDLVKSDESVTALDLKDNPYLEVVSRLSPSELISKFTSTAHPRVQDAVRSTILGLIGNLPKMAFDTTTVTTGERLASLMFQLQMTGYMFKNAEYRLSLTQSLGMDHMPPGPGRMAKGGYLLEGTLSPHHDENDEEYDEDDEDGPSPIKLEGKVRGKIKVKYGGSGGSTKSDDGGEKDDGGDVDDTDDDDDDTTDDDGGGVKSSKGSSSAPSLEVEVDAAAYMSELRAEVSRLREELTTTRKSKDDAVKKDLLLYIRTMPRDELRELTGTMSPDVLSAMKGLVNVVMAGIGEGRVEADTVTEQSGEAMAQLCMWQLVVGYNLRELEVREEMREALGRFSGGGEDPDDGRVWFGEGH